MMLTLLRYCDNGHYLALIYKCRQILEYLLINNIFEDIEEVLLNEYDGSSIAIDLETIQLIFKYVKIGDMSLLNKLSDKLEIDDVYQILATSNIGMNYQIFNKIWNLYKNNFSDNQILDIFNIVCDMDYFDIDIKKVIIKLSQEPCIQKLLD